MGSVNCTGARPEIKANHWAQLLAANCLMASPSRRPRKNLISWSRPVAKA